LEARLTYTATEVGSYERAARMAATWGSPASDGYVQKVTGPAGPKDYYVIKLSDAKISSVATGGTVDGQATESITFRFTHIEIDYTTFDARGASTGVISTCWDIPTCSSGC
jgi:hypothetical protein